MLAVASKIGLDLKDELRLRVNLESEDNALYVGTLFVGAPHSQPVRVIFDTGSEHLTVTSSLCNNVTADDYHFSTENQFSKKMNLEKEEKPEAQPLPMQNLLLDDDDNKPAEKPKPKVIESESRCATMAYNMHDSQSG